MPPKSNKKRDSKSNSGNSKDTTVELKRSGSMLDVTTSNCLLCDTMLRPDEDEDYISMEFRKLFDAFCLFLNLNIAEESSWDFASENFPFCPPCAKYLYYFSAYYDQLEIIHSKIANVVSHVKHKVAAVSIVKKSTSPDKSSSRKRKHNSTEITACDSRIKQIREQLRDGEGEGMDGLPELESIELLKAKSSPREQPIVPTVTVDTESQTNAETEEIPVIKETVTVGVQTEAKDTETECLSSDVDEFEKYVADQMQLLGSESEEENIGEVQDELDDFSDEVVIPEFDVEEPEEIEVINNVPKSTGNVVNNVDSSLVNDKATNNVQPVVDISANSDAMASSSVSVAQSSVIIPVTTSKVQKVSAGDEKASRLDKLVLEPIPPWSIQTTEDGYMYGNVEFKSDGTSYTCSACKDDNSFSSQDLLLDHLESIHLGNNHWYPCDRCDLTFRLVDQFEKHSSRQHRRKIKQWSFVCSFCNKRFYNKELHQRHLQVHGPDEPTAAVDVIDVPDDEMVTATPTSNASVVTPGGGKKKRPKPTLKEVFVSFERKSLRPRTQRKPIIDITSEPEDDDVKQDSNFSDSTSHESNSSVDSDYSSRMDSRRQKKSTPRDRRRATASTSRDVIQYSGPNTSAKANNTESPNTSNIPQPVAVEPQTAEKQSQPVPSEKESTLSQPWKVTEPESKHEPPTVVTNLPKEYDMELNKFILCGGCGNRYFTESDAVRQTIKGHYHHHKLQRALACRICCQCYTSLPEMNAHVREHYDSNPTYTNYIFYCPVERPERPGVESDSDDFD